MKLNLQNGIFIRELSEAGSIINSEISSRVNFCQLVLRLVETSTISVEEGVIRVKLPFHRKKYLLVSDKNSIYTLVRSMFSSVVDSLEQKYGKFSLVIE